MPRCFAIARTRTKSVAIPAPLENGPKPSRPIPMKPASTATSVASSPPKQLQRRGRKFRRDNASLYRYTLRSNFLKKLMRMGAITSMRAQVKFLSPKKETEADPQGTLTAAPPPEGCRSRHIRDKRVSNLIILRARSMEQVKIHRANVAPVITGRSAPNIGGHSVMPSRPPPLPVILKPSAVSGIRLDKLSVLLEKPSVRLDKPYVGLDMPSVKLVSLDKLKGRRSSNVGEDQGWHKTPNVEGRRIVDSDMLEAAGTLLEFAGFPVSDAVLAEYMVAPSQLGIASRGYSSNDKTLKANLSENKVLLPENKVLIPDVNLVTKENDAASSADKKPKKIACEYNGCTYATSRVDNYHQFHLPRHTGNYKYMCDAGNGCTFRSTRRDRLRSHKAGGRNTCPRRL